MSLNTYNSLHITLFKEKESFLKRSFFYKNLLLIFNNLINFFTFLKLHAQFLNLSNLLTNIFNFSLIFYFSKSINFSLTYKCMS